MQRGKKEKEVTACRTHKMEIHSIQIMWGKREQIFPFHLPLFFSIHRANFITIIFRWLSLIVNLFFLTLDNAGKAQGLLNDIWYSSKVKCIYNWVQMEFIYAFGALDFIWFVWVGSIDSDACLYQGCVKKKKKKCVYFSTCLSTFNHRR